MAYGLQKKRMMTPAAASKKAAPVKKMAGSKMMETKKMTPKIAMYKKKM